MRPTTRGVPSPSQGSLNLSPHLYVTPGELAPFRDLLSSLGCRDAFSAEQYGALLGWLAEEAAGRPLDPHQLGQALAVAAALGDLMGSSGAGATQAGGGGTAAAVVRQGLVLPDARGVLRPAAELAYDDAPWLDDDASAGAMAGEQGGTWHFWGQAAWAPALPSAPWVCLRRQCSRLHPANRPALDGCCRPRPTSPPARAAPPHLRARRGGARRRQPPPPAACRLGGQPGPGPGGRGRCSRGFRAERGADDAATPHHL
jgi:hypothetical protein